MMEMTFYIYVLTSVLILGIWRLWFFEYRKFFVDETRQRLFSIRDELFKAAACGELSFDEPLYKMTRTTLNGYIRYTHDLSTIKLLGSIVLSKVLGETPQLKEYNESWEKAFSGVESENAKELIAKVHKDMHLVMFKHILKSSILLRVLIIPLSILFILMNKTLDRIVTSNKAKEEWLPIDVEANSLGQKVA